MSTIWNDFVAHMTTRMMIFGDCVQTLRRRCRQFRNKCFGCNFSHINIVEAPIVLHFEQLVENPQLCLRKPLCKFPATMHSMSTKNVPLVMEEIGDIVGSTTRV